MKQMLHRHADFMHHKAEAIPADNAHSLVCTFRMLDPIKIQPQAIMTMDGRVLDPSILVCAYLRESSEVQVQYAPGPVAFSGRSALQDLLCKRHPHNLSL